MGTEAREIPTRTTYHLAPVVSVPEVPTFSSEGIDPFGVVGLFDPRTGI